MTVVPPKASCYNDLLKKDSFAGLKFSLEEISEALKLKINDLALAKIPTNKSGILSGHCIAIAPQVVFNVLPPLFKNKLFKNKEKIHTFNEERDEGLIEEDSGKYSCESKWIEKTPNVPIGIASNPYNNWINAFMQFIVFIPSLRMMFNYTPKSFSSFNDFIDVYIHSDPKRSFLNKSAVLPVMNVLSRCFANSSFFKYQVVDFFSILNSLMNYVLPFENIDEMNDVGGDLLALFPSWRISLENEDVKLEEYIQKVIFNQRKDKNIVPYELLVNFNWFLKKSKSSEKKAHAPMLLSVADNLFLNHYELDAFVEYREDAFNLASYISYVKIDGLWFQCDDTKIRQIRSNNLHIPLSRSFIFHYKRVILSKEYEKLV